MTRILLHLHYAGTGFHGWQKQPHLETVQSILENAVSKIAGHSVEIIAAGRTDRGVHALGMAAHFDTTAKRPMHAWVAGVNTFLPRGISVCSAQEVAPSFHARFDAVSRSYRYVLSNQAIRPDILHGRIGWSFIPLDIPPMFQAAQMLLGTQDFSSFRSSECQAKSPIKHMYQADVYQADGMICFDFKASGFLHHMIRNIVGALIYVGSHKISIEQFQQIMDSRSRSIAPPTFMADGLYFTGVEYPEHCGIQPFRLPEWFWGKHQ